MIHCTELCSETACLNHISDGLGAVSRLHNNIQVLIQNYSILIKSVTQLFTKSLGLQDEVIAAKWD